MLQDLLAQKGIRQLRATYYFGDAAPYTCWDSFRYEVVDQYLEKMKRDGFNCVIMLIPGSIPEIEVLRPEFAEFFWSSLLMLIERARLHGLFVLFRLNYIWDRFPIKLDRYRLTFFHHVPGNERTRLSDFLARLYACCTKYDNFLYAFVTWEDATMYLLDNVPKLGLVERAAVAEALGYVLPDEGQLDGHRQAVPPPQSHFFKHYLEFLDEMLVCFYRFVRTSFPLLSMEVRCDTFPYRDKTGAALHHVHSKSYNLPELDIFGTYYGIYMGARNDHEQLSAKEAFENFASAHRGVLSRTPHASTPLVFIDQLLFCIREQAFSHFAWMDEEAQSQFIEMCAAWMQVHSVGFAIWSFQDYVTDQISNSSFSLQCEGWRTHGDVIADKGAGSGCVVRGGGALWQTVARRLAKPVLLLEAQALEDSELLVRYAEGSSTVLRLPAREAAERIVLELEAEAHFLALRVVRGAVRLAKVSLGAEVASHGAYTLGFAETKVTAALIELNRALGALPYDRGDGKTALPDMPQGSEAGSLSSNAVINAYHGDAAAASDGNAGYRTGNDDSEKDRVRPHFKHAEYGRSETLLQWPVGTALVSTVHKILYMPIAKNACTSLKRLMVTLSDSPLKENILSARGFHRFLADNRTGVTLRDRGVAEATAIVNDPSWLKFVVLRNPLERLVSGYLQKFVDLRTPDHAPLPETRVIIESVYAQRGQQPDLRRSISFREFVHYLMHHEDAVLDSHWRSQICYLTGIQYNFIGRVEDMSLIRKVLEARVGEAIEIGSFNAIRRAQPGGQSGMTDLVAAEMRDAQVYPRAEDLVDADLEAAIGLRYKDDFELYRAHFGDVRGPGTLGNQGGKAEELGASDDERPVPQTVVTHRSA